MSIMETAGATNQAQVTLSALNQMNGSLEMTSSILAGTMVQEFDQQINLYNAELLGTNAQKAEVRQDKVNVMDIAANPEADTEGGKNPDGTAMAKGVVLNQVEITRLGDLASQYGVEVSFHNDKTGSTYVTTAQLTALQEAIEGKLSDLNSSSELKLIQFQSLMDARKQAMMMLSNMLSSNNSTMMSIIQNLKN